MYLRDLEVGSELIVQSIDDKSKLEFQTKILAKKDDKVILTPIYDEGKLVNFTPPKVTTNIIYSTSMAEYRFPNVFIINTRAYNNLILHEVSGDIMSELVNRRSTPRYVIDKMCIFTPGAHRYAEQAYIKDISMNGIGIISDLKVDTDEIVTISFEPTSNTKRRIDVRAKVTRVVKDDITSKHLYGCKILGENASLNKYVMEIQRSRISLHKKNQ